MIDKGIDPSLVISIVNNNVLLPLLTLEVTSILTDNKIIDTSILIIKVTEYTETAIPFYIYLSPSIPIRVGKLSNKVVKAIYNSSTEANIIYQTYVNKYKFNKLPIRMTFHRFGYTREYYKVIKEYI